MGNRQEKEDTASFEDHVDERRAIEDHLASGAWEERLAKAHALREKVLLAQGKTTAKPQAAATNDLQRPFSMDGLFFPKDLASDTSKTPAGKPVRGKKDREVSVPINVRMEEARKQRDQNVARRQNATDNKPDKQTETSEQRQKNTIRLAMAAKASDNELKHLRPIFTETPEQSAQEHKKRRRLYRAAYIALGVIVGFGAGILLQNPLTNYLTAEGNTEVAGLNIGQSADLDARQDALISDQATPISIVTGPTTANQTAITVQTQPIAALSQPDLELGLPNAQNVISLMPITDTVVAKIQQSSVLTAPIPEPAPDLRNLTDQSANSPNADVLTLLDDQTSKGKQTIFSAINVPTVSTLPPILNPQIHLTAQTAGVFADFADITARQIQTRAVIDGSARLISEAGFPPLVAMERGFSPTESAPDKNGIMILALPLQNAPKHVSPKIGFATVPQGAPPNAATTSRPVLLVSAAPNQPITKASFGQSEAGTLLPSISSDEITLSQARALVHAEIIGALSVPTDPPENFARTVSVIHPKPKPLIVPKQNSTVPGWHAAFAIHIHAPVNLPEEKLTAFANMLSETGFPVRTPKRVGFTIKKNNVRFYHPGDKDTAQLLASAIGGQARDFTSYSPAPPTGTIEIWLAGDAPKVRKKSTRRSRPTEDPALKALRSRLLNSLRRGDHL